MKHCPPPSASSQEPECKYYHFLLGFDHHMVPPLLATESHHLRSTANILANRFYCGQNRDPPPQGPQFQQIHTDKAEERSDSHEIYQSQIPGAISDECVQ